MQVSGKFSSVDRCAVLNLKMHRNTFFDLAAPDPA